MNGALINEKLHNWADKKNFPDGAIKIYNFDEEYFI
jgi:hypothetical protein